MVAPVCETVSQVLALAARQLSPHGLSWLLMQLHALMRSDVWHARFSGCLALQYVCWTCRVAGVWHNVDDADADTDTARSALYSTLLRLFEDDNDDVVAAALRAVRALLGVAPHSEHDVESSDASVTVDAAVAGRDGGSVVPLLLQLLQRSDDISHAPADALRIVAALLPAMHYDDNVIDSTSLRQLLRCAHSSLADVRVAALRVVAAAVGVNDDESATRYRAIARLGGEDVSALLHTLLCAVLVEPSPAAARVAHVSATQLLSRSEAAVLAAAGAVAADAAALWLPLLSCQDHETLGGVVTAVAAHTHALQDGALLQRLRGAGMPAFSRRAATCHVVAVALDVAAGDGDSHTCDQPRMAVQECGAWTQRRVVPRTATEAALLTVAHARRQCFGRVSAAQLTQAARQCSLLEGVLLRGDAVHLGCAPECEFLARDVVQALEDALTVMRRCGVAGSRDAATLTPLVQSLRVATGSCDAAASAAARGGGPSDVGGSSGGGASDTSSDGESPANVVDVARQLTAACQSLQGERIRAAVSAIDVPLQDLLLMEARLQVTHSHTAPLCVLV
jgi:hypothetical protein